MERGREDKIFGVHEVEVSCMMLKHIKVGTRTLFGVQVRIWVCMSGS